MYYKKCWIRLLKELEALESLNQNMPIPMGSDMIFDMIRSIEDDEKEKETGYCGYCGKEIKVKGTTIRKGMYYCGCEQGRGSC
jgi:hypothetical protein